MVRKSFDGAALWIKGSMAMALRGVCIIAAIVCLKDKGWCCQCTSPHLTSLVQFAESCVCIPDHHSLRVQTVCSHEVMTSPRSILVQSATCFMIRDSRLAGRIPCFLFDSIMCSVNATAHPACSNPVVTLALLSSSARFVLYLRSLPVSSLRSLALDPLTLLA